MEYLKKSLKELQQEFLNVIPEKNLTEEFAKELKILHSFFFEEISGGIMCETPREFPGIEKNPWKNFFRNFQRKTITYYETNI